MQSGNERLIQFLVSILTQEGLPAAEAERLAKRIASKVLLLIVDKAAA